jgi:hypothetical protein
LPKLFVELYLNVQKNPEVNVNNNSKGKTCDGLRMTCEPMMAEHSKHIAKVLAEPDANFPFEYYAVKFMTFAREVGFPRFPGHIE